jgi:hypothetical protein
MITWILVYSFSVPNNAYFNKPVVMDQFTSREHCEKTLEYINNTYLQAGIVGKGYCWGEEHGN